ncbi:hypothetical protein ACLKA7_000310 [Drosophila subpalustris]
MLTIDRIFCFLGLKWGILIIATVDTAICAFGIYDADPQELMDYYLLAISIFVAHLVASILIIVSVFKNNKFLILLYLITANVRLIYTSVTFVWHNVMYSLYTAHLILEYLILAISFYFWFCAYSWYKALSVSSTVGATTTTTT